MKKYQLTRETQGFAEGQIFEGPTPIPPENITHGYFPQGIDPSSKFCFFASFVESQPDLFKQITE